MLLPWWTRYEGQATLPRRRESDALGLYLHVATSSAICSRSSHSGYYAAVTARRVPTRLCCMPASSVRTRSTGASQASQAAYCMKEVQLHIAHSP